MQYRSLGRTGIQVSGIGFGAWGIGGDARGSIAYGPADREESLSALRRAIDLGVNFFDTADFYGYGRSESLLGEAFDGRRQRVVIASKVGMVDGSGTQDFSVAHIRRSLSNTLDRLSTDFVDLYQLHSPSPEELDRPNGPVEALRALKADGRVRAIGVSLRAPQDGLGIVRSASIDCVQVNFNLLDQRALYCGLFDACIENGVGIVCRTPLCFGFLTGKYQADAKYPDSDHRSRWSLEQRKRWASGAELFGKWRSGEDETAAQFALRFCLSFDAVSSAIPGMMTPAQVEENAISGELDPLPESALAEIRKRYQQQDFFVGPPR